MLPLIFEKHKICSNRTKSLKIVKINPVLSAKTMRILRLSVVFYLIFPSFYNVIISLNKGLFIWRRAVPLDRAASARWADFYPVFI